MKMMRTRTKRREEDEGSTREVMLTFEVVVVRFEKQGDAPPTGCGGGIMIRIKRDSTTYTSKLLRLRITFTFFFFVCVSITLVRGDTVDFLPVRLQLELSRIRRVAHVADVSRVQVRL